MSDPIAAAEAAGKARDIANRFETAVFLIAYGIAEKDGLYEADPHRYPYSQAFRHGMNILAALPEATDPTACIVVLPGAESYKPKGKDDGGDPKRALRIAFAKTGRLTQFIEPEDSKDSPEIRARVAVRDLMRQLGFVPEPARNSRGIDTSIPAIGLKVYNSGNGKARASFPYCVRQDMRSGAVTVYCPLLPDGSLPYWRALIEFARLSGSEGFPDSCKRANGMALKRMLHGIVRATGDRPELLLINSYGRIRQRDWWPGISDSGLESGPLSYGPTGYEEPLGLAGSKLRILRIRSGLNGEIPDWFTDEVAAGGADDGTVPNRRDKQGLFKMDGYFLALAPRPGDAQYKWSARGSKYDSPTAAFCEKTINEYCLLSPGGEAEALASVKYAEALRGCMVQLYKNDMRVNLPAPLHLAEQVEEYSRMVRRSVARTMRPVGHEIDPAGVIDPDLARDQGVLAAQPRPYLLGKLGGHLAAVSFPLHGTHSPSM